MLIAKITKQEGFSLVEIIMSMFIISVLFILAIIVASVLPIITKQSNENIAYHIAVKQMEELRATDFDSLPASGTITDPLLDDIPEGSGSFSVSDYPGHDGVKEIIVTINWDDGILQSAVVKTLAVNGGINQ